MRITRSLEYQIGSKEEKPPYVTPDFPYVALRAELDFYREPFVPWHWHNAIELFYVESGELKYHTPNETLVFPSGSAGMVNANVLHMTQIQTRREKNVQLLSRMNRAGCRFVVASGNQYYQLRDLFPGYYDELSFVAENGAFVKDQILKFAPTVPEEKTFYYYDIFCRQLKGKL